MCLGQMHCVTHLVRKLRAQLETVVEVPPAPSAVVDLAISVQLLHLVHRRCTTQGEISAAIADRHCQDVNINLSLGTCCGSHSYSSKAFAQWNLTEFARAVVTDTAAGASITAEPGEDPNMR